jgi:hypothetical protein
MQTTHTEPFSMDRFAWNNRPLVIFAPSPADPRYRDQLAAVEANRAGFEARDMVWIEVFESEARSHAGGEPLTAEETETLRERFETPRGQYTLLLVGKDTTVKRRTSEPVSMQSLFDQIDQMPMRQREMKRGDASHNQSNR